MRKTGKHISLLVSMTLAFGLLPAGCAESRKAPESPESPRSSRSTGSESPGYLVNEGRLTVAGSKSSFTVVNWLNGKPQGFEYDLLLAIADDLNLKLDYVALDTQAQEAGVVTGRLDMASSMLKPDFADGFTFTDPQTSLSYNSSQLHYSNPYFEYSMVCLVKDTSEIKGITDLEGKVVGVCADPIFDTILPGLPDMTVIVFHSDDAGLAAVRSGEIDAYVMHMHDYYQFFQANNPDLQSVDVISTEERLYFVFSADNPEMERVVNESLERLIDDGTYETLFSRYFDFEPTILRLFR